MDSETEFLKGLIELQYGRPVEKRLQEVAQKISWAQGWPADTTAFWNAEAFMWSHKIEKEKREVIEQELSPLSWGNNLDLGCGSYSYLPSMGLDISPKMIKFNERCTSKMIADLEQPLPIAANSFDSVTAVFVFNYIQNYRQLLSEVQRILIGGGTLVMVLSAGGVQDWHRQKEVNKLSSTEWITVLQNKGFKVKFQEQERLWFFVGTKRAL